MNRYRHSIVTAAFGLLFLALTACGGGEKARLQANLAQTVLAGAAILYAHEHDNNLPNTLQDLRSYTSKAGAYGTFEETIENPFTGDNPGYELANPGSPLSYSPRKIMVYQLRDGKRDTSLNVAYEDGHSGEYIAE